MREKRLYAMIGVGVLLVLTVMLVKSLSNSPTELPLLEVGTPAIDQAPMCPWRQPEADLQGLFPGATRHQTETRILSSLRMELAQRLGRMPTSEENSINLYRVYTEQNLLGTIMTRRIKGEFGAIEIVLGVNTNGAVTGLRLQRLREPDAIATVLTNASWLTAFRGKTADSQWQFGQDLPEVSVAARPSAEAIVDGVRSLLVLLDTAEKRKIHVAHKRHKL